tara:strand:+ start:884620 stop:886851 length:2232 start_codon:yes stop_codon:yes gene_type:complete
LETRKLLAANLFHNEVLPEDVNDDGQITALDAVTVINQMSRQSFGDQASINADVRGTGRMTDVNNDGRETALDALMIINRLSRDSFRGPEQNDGHANPTIPSDDAADEVDEDSTLDSGADTSGDDGVEDTDTSDVATSAESNDVVLQWNDLFGDILSDSTENQNPGYASRSMAILNLAIYDAVAIASGHSEETFYEYDAGITDLSSGTGAEVAATSAAYTVLSDLYPDQQARLDAFLEDSLANLSFDGDVTESLALGEQVGLSILATRADDGSDVVGEYTYTDEVGYFQPDPLNPDVPAWGPEWGNVETFAISSVDEFSPDTTPALTSEEYAASYNEVVALGSVDSTERTAEQTEAGIFWAYDREGLGTPLSIYSDVLETIAVQEGNSFEENVQLFAQASVAMADAAVVAWDTKFSEEFWRPVTAIQQGDSDGNALTDGGEGWTALGAPDGGDDIVGFTPQFPTYISGHATFGGALFGTLQEFYGTDDISFDLTSEELEILLEDLDLQEAYGLDLDDATRSFDSLSEAMAENGRSRVYLGIHFDFDDLVGQEVGQAVAAAVSSEFAASSNASEDSFQISGTVVDVSGVGNDHEIMQSMGMGSQESRPMGLSDFGSASLFSDADLTRLARDQVNRQDANLASNPVEPSQDRMNNGNRTGNRQGELDGAEGVTVELLDSEGTLIEQAVTDARGRYTFDSILDIGTYQIQIAQSDLWMVVGTDLREVLVSEDHVDFDRINFHVSLV